MAAFTAVVMALSLIGPFGGEARADHPPDNVDATPDTDTNTVGTEHEIEVTATEGDPPDNTTFTGFIRFTVTSGPNAGTSGSCPVEPGVDGDAGPTNICTYTSNGQAGTDTILVFADLDGSGTFTEGEPSDDVEKTWEAGDPAGISISPTSASSAVGNCNPFTATMIDEFGNPVEDGTVRVRQTHETTTATVDWCEPSTGPEPVAPAETDAIGTNDKVATAGPTDENGQVTFGITSNATGTVTVQVWPDGSAGSTDTTPGPIAASATKTWTAGGAASVTQLTVSPTSASNPTGTTHTFTLTARNAQGDLVGGVTVNGRVESGPNTTHQDSCVTGTSAATTPPVGTCEITHSSGSTGTDNWRFWVNQPPPPGETATTGPDPHEPQATASKTWTAPPVVGDIEVTCEGTVANVADDDCVNPVDDPTETFTALVTDTEGNPMSGVRVDWAVSGPEADKITLNPTNCTTGADGTCSTTATNANPAAGDNITVTGTVAGSGESDSADKTWQAREPQIDLEPDFDTNEQGTSHTVTATVADQFGQPFANQNVNFSVTGRNAIAPQARTTNAAGQATFTYTDTAPAGPAANDTITGEHTGPATPAAGIDQVTKRWIPEPAVAAVLRVSLDDCADAQTANPTRTATNVVGSGDTVFAYAETAGGEILQGHTIEFSSTGVGRFGTATVDQGTSRTETIGADGCASVDIYSEQAGTQSITATKDGQSDTATKTWVADNARNISLSPEEDTNPPGQNHEITALVVDRFGNPVANVAVSWSRSGAGFIVSQETTTNAFGEARIVIRSEDEGSTTVMASLNPAETDCNLPAGTPPGAPAGNCSATATKAWAEDVDTIIAVARSVGLGPSQLRNRGIAQGMLRQQEITLVQGDPEAVDRFPVRWGCIRNQRMRVQRFNFRLGRWVTVRRPFTRVHGFYRAPRRILTPSGDPRPGRYRTVAPFRQFVGPDDVLVRCLRAVSPVRRVPRR